MRRQLPVAAFVALAIATIAAFFITQHLKVTTPLIAGYPAPHPSAINPVSGGTCTTRNGKGESVATDFREMQISFYLLKRADDVDVAVVDPSGRPVATLATNRHMARDVRTLFTWNGRRADGTLAPEGRYDVRVSLVHQGRSLRIANQNTGDAEPVRVQHGATPIRVTSVRASGVEPAVIPQANGRSVVVHFTRTSRTPPTIRVYRTDLPGRPRLVNSYQAKSFRNSFWNGRLHDGRLAPQGTYLIGLAARDRTCSRQVFPASLPPPPGGSAHAGVTVRYLAAQPPMTAVTPGADATVEVDARRHRYAWALRPAGSARVLRSGRSSAVSLRVPLPAGAPGLYELAVRYGAHRRVVPIVAGTASLRRGPRPGRVLVVLPSLTWQGLNPVDDDGDGVPNTLAAGLPIRIERPFAQGLPSGIADEIGLLRYLRATGLRYTLTTDVSLIADDGASLRRFTGVVFAGSERWLPASLGSALQTWVQSGGHVLSLGIDALRRSVTVSRGSALDPSAPHAVDDLLARPGPVRPVRGAIILVDSDGLHIFRGGSQALRGFARYQSFGPVSSPAVIRSSAGVTPTAPAVIGYRLGRGTVVDVGLLGFGRRLASDPDAAQLVSRTWRQLSAR